MAKGHTLDRDQLYAEVWSEAMTKVSKRHGISDVALAKICRRMNVPVPERGYWARVAAGQKLSRPPLPSREQGVPQTVQTDPGRGRPWASEMKTVDRSPVPVPDVLSSPHRLTLQLQKSFSLRRPDSYGRVGSSREDIDVKIAPSSIPRVAEFAKGLLEELFPGACIHVAAKRSSCRWQGENAQNGRSEIVGNGPAPGTKINRHEHHSLDPRRVF